MSAESKSIRIVLIDDHAVVREGLRVVIEDQPGLTVVGEYSDGAEAVAHAASLDVDVAVVDLRMPGLGGVATVKRLRETNPAIQVLVFTSFAEDGQVQEVLDAGAIGYLLKDALQHELVDAIRAVAAGTPWLHPSAQKRLVDMLQRSKASLPQLTSREASVLRLLADGQSNKQIANTLLLTEGTVKGYVSQILNKLQVNDRTQAALYAVRSGLLEMLDAV